MISMPRIGLQHKHSLAVVLTSLISLAAPILRAQEAPESSAPQTKPRKRIRFP